jgi:hypothetical protein
MLEIQCLRPHPHRKDKFGSFVIDYSQDKPFIDWPPEMLFKCLKVALKQDKINLEIASLIWRHLKTVDGNHEKAKEIILKAEGNLIPWLSGLHYRISHLAKTFKPKKLKGKNCKVYFILLTEERTTPKPWGLYIGQTFRPIEDRFTQHLDENNKKKSGHVYRRGWQVLDSISAQVPAMARSDVLRFERVALDSLKGILKSKTIRGLNPKHVKGA